MIYFMKKVYITGISGMLGSNIGYLFKNKYSVCGVDKIILKKMDILLTEKFDLLDFDMLSRSIKRFKPDYLIHTAAMVNVDLCEEKKELAYNLNTKLTGWIADICNEINCKMIYISTDAVFDGVNEKLYKETDITNPVNIYGKTKLEGENKVIQNPNNLILRTNIYGFNIQDKSSFGEWVLNGLDNDNMLKMFYDIDFSPILVNDLTELIDKAIENGLSGIYHACGSGCISKYDFGCYLKKIFHIKNGKIIRTSCDGFNFKAERSRHMGMSNKKISDELCCKIRSPEDSIREFYRLYCEGYPEKLKTFGGM